MTKTVDLTELKKAVEMALFRESAITKIVESAPAMIAELERLRYQVELYKAEMSAAKEAGFETAHDLFTSYEGRKKQFQSFVDENRKLIAEKEALRKDAERYRWLKSRKSHNVTLTDATGCRDKVVFVYMAENLDSAIEHAIAEEEKK